MGKYQLGFKIFLFSVLGAFANFAFAEADKVDVCHVEPEKHINKISISVNALPDHLSHGDKIIGVDVDENCDPLQFCFAVLAEFPPYAPEIHSVTYWPSTGDVFGVNVSFGGTISGTISPPGQPEDSIFAAGTTYNFITDGYPIGDWWGTGTTSDSSGLFTGTWEGDPADYDPPTGDATYQFVPSDCN